MFLIVEKIICQIVPKPMITSRDPSPNPKQSPSLHATFRINAQVPLEMWKRINEQLEAPQIRLKETQQICPKIATSEENIEKQTTNTQHGKAHKPI